MGTIPVALQLYSVRDAARDDLAGTLKRVAEMGYDGVEFAGFHGHAAAAVRDMVAAAGLRVAGAHVGLETLLGAALPESVAYHATLGNRFLVVPGLAPEHRGSAASWRQTAERFNRISRALAPHGMATGYHNHNIEFTPMDGELPWDIFFGATDAAVIMQLDTGNALDGGGDPADLLRRYPGRARTVHLKSHARANPDALIGADDVRWPDIFALCATVGGTEWYIIEQERYPFPPLVSVEKCLQAVRRMGV